MDSVSRLKRPTFTPSKDDVCSIYPVKRQKTNHNHIPRTTQHPQGQSHSVPANIIPIIHPPNSITDFFTDLTTDLTDVNLTNQISGILRKYPPPLPPMTPRDEPMSGYMVPFIYPPPPILNCDDLPYSLASFKKKFNQLSGDDETEKVDRETETEKVDRETETEKVDHETGIYVQAPPLPFPPLRYMPYPLEAEKSQMVPSEVFDTFLEASEVLPRVDMVVASAAGSLFEMKTQAELEGFYIDELEGDIKNDDDEIDSKNEYVELPHFLSEEDREYYSKIDINEYNDPYLEKRNQVEISNEYVKIDPLTSNVKGEQEMKGYTLQESTCRDSPIYNPTRSIGNQRNQILQSTTDIERFTNQNRTDLYHHKRSQIILRIEKIQQSKISFDHCDLSDHELRNFQHKCELERDEKLVGLKIVHDYQLLKNSLTFYQDSNRIYKHLNFVLINKLQKLKNFFEYQKNLFQQCLMNKSDIFDIRSKESSKIYHNYLSKDYLEEFKNILQNSNPESVTESKIDDLEIAKVLQENNYNSKSIKQNSVLVHDFMPLITGEEFNIITGNISSLKKPIKNNDTKVKSFKHKIFQNSIYEKMHTSGSDTNLSDSGGNTSTSKRRGARRTTASQEESSNSSQVAFNSYSIDVKLSDSALQTKITKQFIGPQSARPEEIQRDMKMMGIKTKWPVVK